MQTKWKSSTTDVHHEAGSTVLGNTLQITSYKFFQTYDNNGEKVLTSKILHNCN